jgi:hypothetical protein
MAYNHKKRLQKKAESSPQNREQSLQEYNKDWGNSLPESITNYNGLLGKTRGEGTSDPDQTIEALMDKPRKEASDSDSRTTEGQLDKRESYQTHRDAEHYDASPMLPINALAGASDAKFHKEYAKVSKGGDDRLLDRDPGSQMSGPKTKVVKNVPESGSQLQNHPSRFAQSPRGRMILATLQDADKVLFDIYYRAASEKRELTDLEKKIEAQMTSDKKAVLAQFNPQPPQPVPQQQHSQRPPQQAPGSPTDVPGAVPPSDPRHPHGDVNSEFYPKTEGDPFAEPTDIDEALIEQMLGGTPTGGVDGFYDPTQEPSELEKNRRDDLEYKELKALQNRQYGGEDIDSPDFENIHNQERQEIEFDPMDEHPQPRNEQPRF